MSKTTVSRKGVNLGISEKNGEHCLMLGNQILSRHATESEAVAAFHAEFAARKGRHTPHPCEAA